MRYNPKNERIKREYLNFKQHVDAKDNKSIDLIRKAISHYEAFTQHKDFRTFDSIQATTFKKHMLEHIKTKQGQNLRLATTLSILKHAQTFFRWLAMQKGYKSQIRITDIEYMNLTDNQCRTARSSAPVDYPSIEQIRRVLETMPHDTDIQKRDRAVIAFTILTCARVSAIISLKLKHFDHIQRLVSQDPNDVKTKFAKRIETYLFPIGDDIVQIFLDWVSYLKTDKLFAPNDPLFPKTLNTHDKNLCFVASGIGREHWQGTQGVRNLFKSAFEGAGLKYYHPHSFRHTLTHIGQDLCKTPEEFKAWSQNTGHEGVLTTFTSYGRVAHHRQGELIKGLGR